MSYLKLTNPSGTIHLVRSADLPDESIVFCTMQDTYATYTSSSFNLCVIVTNGSDFDLAYFVLRPWSVILYIPARTVKKINSYPIGTTWYVENLYSSFSNYFNSWNSAYSQVGYLNIRYTSGTYGYYKLSKFQFNSYAFTYDIKDT